MNVRMPNGTMIKNVPAGTTKEELAFKLNNSYSFNNNINLNNVIPNENISDFSGLNSNSFIY